nr:uncharacterized protein LOC120974772 [Aegilops tauschii subsp. strangulata]
MRSRVAFRRKGRLHAAAGVSPLAFFQCITDPLLVNGAAPRVGTPFVAPSYHHSSCLGGSNSLIKPPPIEVQGKEENSVSFSSLSSAWISSRCSCSALPPRHTRTRAHTHYTRSLCFAIFCTELARRKAAAASISLDHGCASTDRRRPPGGRPDQDDASSRLVQKRGQHEPLLGHRAAGGGAVPGRPHRRCGDDGGAGGGRAEPQKPWIVLNEVLTSENQPWCSTTLVLKFQQEGNILFYLLGTTRLKIGDFLPNSIRRHPGAEHPES